MRHDQNLRRGVRGNALWGRRGDSRSNALWGSGKRGMITLALAAMLVVPMASSAASGGGNAGGAVVPNSLLANATANPSQMFDVIVQGDKQSSGSDVAKQVQEEHGKSMRSFMSVAGVQASISGKDLLKLARQPHISAITPNVAVHSTSYEDNTMWQDSTDLTSLQNNTDPNTGEIVGPAPQAPAIAIVDSGVQARSDFGGRLVARVNLCSLCSDSSEDAEGHGTMVAGVAAGSGTYPGGAQNAPLVSIRTSNGDGQSRTTDVIAAADWILQHAQQYNIRVANFSLAGASDTSIRVDPLDKAVESLWLNGIVVVAAAGNHGVAGGPVSMSYAPGNDPFVITVGATDQRGTSDPSDDTIPSWSAHGTTMDGFSKPDVSAPGRYMIAPAPMDGTIAKTVPDRIVAPGYMWMSGTSFATPVVSAAAAQILARHPGFTPDQVKGALMLTSNWLPNDSSYAGGVGEIDAGIAASIDAPPNPNSGLYKFVGKNDATAMPVFDGASWAEFLKSGASWAQASWNEASWANASWNEASWANASWNEASWSSSVDSMMSSTASYSESTFSP
jgi:serine protease AprX